MQCADSIQREHTEPLDRLREVVQGSVACQPVLFSAEGSARIRRA